MATSKAWSSCEDWISLPMRNWNVCFHIGLSGIYKKLGREEEAKKTMEEAIEQLGVNPEEVKGLGDDEFVSMEEYMKNAYNALNPFGL